MFSVIGRVRPCGSVFTPICVSKRLKYDKRKKTVVGYTEAAQRHYDFHIGQKMGSMWPSIRLALLSQSKHCAVLNRFCQNYEGTLRSFAETGGFDFVAKFKDPLENTGKYSILKEGTNIDEDDTAEMNYHSSWEAGASMTTPLSDFNFYTPAKRVISNMEMLVEKEAEIYGNIEIPKSTDISIERPESGPFPTFVTPHMLKAVVYAKGDITRFKPAKRDPASGKLGYYLMDAGSVLPVLALDLEPDCSVLDLCAAPGGKTYAMLQTMLPASVVCTDISFGRVLRLKEVIRDFFPHSYLDDGKVRIEHKDATNFGHDNPNQFDRVLVDVPCFADRHSLTELDNNLFSPSRQGDRMMIQNKQQSLLLSAIRACKPGGIIVYSTCTLLPPQNDGTIRSTLEHIHSQTMMEVSVVDTGYLAES